MMTIPKPTVHILCLQLLHNVTDGISNYTELRGIPGPMVRKQSFFPVLIIQRHLIFYLKCIKYLYQFHILNNIILCNRIINMRLHKRGILWCFGWSCVMMLNISLSILSYSGSIINLLLFPVCLSVHTCLHVCVCLCVCCRDLRACLAKLDFP